MARIDIVGVEVACCQCGKTERVEREPTSDEPGGVLPEGWYLIRRSNWVSLADFCSLDCAQALMTEPDERCILEALAD
jgi:hypothetical protein